MLKQLAHTVNNHALNAYIGFNNNSTSNDEEVSSLESPSIHVAHYNTGTTNLLNICGKKFHLSQDVCYPERDLVVFLNPPRQILGLNLSKLSGYKAMLCKIHRSVPKARV